MALRGLRADIEADLKDTVETEFASPVTLIDPNGGVQNVLGSIRYDYIEVSPGGEQIVVKKPMVVLRLSSLSRVPTGDEQWVLKMPAKPTDTVLSTWVLDGKTKAPERADSIGYILLFPLAVAQA